jgi:hypothetical protein
MARGRHEQARATFAALAKRRYPVVAAAAQLELARLAEMRAEWDSVLAANDAGIERVLGNSSARVAAADYLVPGLVVRGAHITTHAPGSRDLVFGAAHRSAT